MKIITNLEAMVEVAAITQQDFQTMDMPGAWQLAIPNREWLLFEFLPFWWDWKRGLGLEEGGTYQRGSGMCEWITREFVNRLAVSCRKAEIGRDWNPAGFECRGSIPSGYSLNGVTDGGHAPALICTHTENNSNEEPTPPQSRRWAIAEPQSWSREDFWTPLEDAIAGGFLLRVVVN